MRYIILVLLLWQVGIADAFSQKEVQGAVVFVNSKGKLEPVPFANVHWQETNFGTTTDSNGFFRLAVPENANYLITSFIGYKSDTLRVENFNKPISISLKKASNTLGEVEVEYRQRSSEMSFINPLATITMNEKELFKAACCNLSESFETNPAVDVNFTDAVTGTKQIRMLGLNGPYTMISRENMPGIRGLGNAFGLSFVPGLWVNSIQVTKGVGSVVNGYESIAGQINVELVKPDLGEQTFVNLFNNLGGRSEFNAGHTEQLKEHVGTTVLLHGNTRFFEVDANDDGFRDFPLQNQINALNRWKFTSNKGLMAQIGVHILKEEKVGGQTDEYIDRNENSFTWQGPYRINIDSESAELFGKVGYVFSDFKYKSMGFQWSLKQHEQNSTFGNRIYDVRQRSGYANFIYQSIIGNTNHQFKTGASFVYDEYDENFENQSFDRAERTPGAFFEYTFKPNANFTMVAGLRGDYHNIYGAFASPRIHFRYALSETLMARALAGSGQRSPTVLMERQSLMASARAFNFFGDNADGVYGLDMEKAWNFGFNLTKGFTLDYREGSIQFDIYRTQFENQVVVDMENSYEVNIYNLTGESYSTTAQIQVDYELIKFLDVRLAYRWAQVETDFNLGGVEENQVRLQQAYTPEHRFFINFGYATRKTLKESNWTIDFTAQLLSEQRIPSTENNLIGNRREQVSPSFTLLISQVTRNFNTRWAVYVGVENMLNYRQEDPIIDADNPFGDEFDASMVWGPIFGRNIYAGMRWKIAKE